MAFKPFRTFGSLVCSALLAPLIFFAVLATAPPTLAAPLKIIAFGDSLMAGYQLGPDEGFVPQLQAALRNRGYDATVVDAAVPGETTSGGKARLDWSVPADADLVLLEFGANDMLRGLPPETVKANLDAMLARLDERRIPAILVGMRSAPQLGPQYVRAFESIYPDLAEKHHVPLVPFFLDGVAARREMLLGDGMHPNPEGVKILVGNVLPAVVRVIESRSGTAG